MRKSEWVGSPDQLAESFRGLIVSSLLCIGFVASIYGAILVSSVLVPIQH